MNHPLIVSTRNGIQCMPTMDYIDPIPTSDGAIRNAYNSPIALTYNDTYTPTSYEIRRLTPKLTQAQFALYYKKLNDHSHITYLPIAITQLINHYKNYMVNKLDFDSTIHILVLEAFNLWLRQNNRWFMLAPPPNVPFSISYPSYIFYLNKTDTETEAGKARSKQRAPKKHKLQEQEKNSPMQEEEDTEGGGENEEEEKESINSSANGSSLLSICLQVVNGCLTNTMMITANVMARMLKDRMSDLLLKSNFSPMCVNLPENTPVRVYDIHGLSKSNRSIYTMRIPDTSDSFWCHMTFEPDEYIWPNLEIDSHTKQGHDNKHLAYSMVARLLNESSLSALRKFIDTTVSKIASLPVQSNTITKYVQKRSRSKTATDKLIQYEELRLRNTFHNDTLYHPLQLRYSYYARYGMVYLNPVRIESDETSSHHNYHSLYDPMGVTEQYWIWLKKIHNSYTNNNITGIHYYYNTVTRSIRGGSRLLLDSPSAERTCKIPVRTTTVRDSSGSDITGGTGTASIVYWYAHLNTEVIGYEQIYLLTWLMKHNELAQDLNRSQDVLDALFTFCESATEAYLNLINIYPHLRFKDLQSNCKATLKQRVLAIKLNSSALDDWMKQPTDLNLYRASKQILSNNHTVTNLDQLPHQVSEDIDDLCKTLTFVKPKWYVDSKIEVEYTTRGTDGTVSTTTATFNGLIQYLARCKALLNSKIIYPIVRAWTIYHPVTSQHEERIGESCVALLRQLTISEICSPQFQLNIQRLRDKIASETVVGLNTKDLELLTYAYHIIKHEVPTTDPTLMNIILILQYNQIDVTTTSNSSVLLKAIGTTRTSVNKDELFLEQCKHRIRFMMRDTKSINPLTLLDIGDQMSYKYPGCDIEDTLFTLICEVITENKTDYTPIASHFHTVYIHHINPFIVALASRIRPSPIIIV